MTLEEFHAKNPNLLSVVKIALKKAANAIGGISELKKIEWFCSNADQHIANEASHKEAA